jgi:hypothetical protein
MTFAPQEPQEPWKQKTTRPTPFVRNNAGRKRTRGEDPVPAPGHSKENLPNDYRKINGWGADLDPANRPAIPREFPSDVMTARGDVKYWQAPRTKIYVSNEQPGMTPVFGESCPPSGLSKFLRDYAYQYGEGANRRWMTLILADRVNLIESTIAEVLRGNPDNYVKEKGWNATMKNGSWTKPVVIGAAVVGSLAVLGYFLSREE